jgi:hypothetical protein
MSLTELPVPDHAHAMRLVGHSQTADDLLLVVHAKDLCAEFRDESAYYGGSVGTKLAGSERNWSAGLAIYDISRPATPRRRSSSS